MKECNFNTPDEVEPLYGEIVPAYQEAFSGEPWYEVSKCADQLQRCVSGLSSLAIGTSCELCGNCPSRPAYEEDELVERFEALAASRPTAWYTEQNKVGLTLAAIAWEAEPSVVALEKYTGVPEMKDWLDNYFETNKIAWLDEVFANKRLSSTGNLHNFRNMVTGLAERLGAQTIAYRTIHPAMIRAATRDFGNDAAVFSKNTEVPDRRDFVVISMEKEQRV